MATQLNLETVCAVLSVCEVNGANTSSTRWANLSLISSNYRYEKIIGCHILPVITVSLPVQSINISRWIFLENVQNNSADPEFNVSSEIDLLLGAEIFYELIHAPPTMMPGGLP